MMSIRSNFFYTRTVPCELWFFDRGKPAERRDQVLMLDARNVFHKVSRRVNDFSPEQQQNLASIVWLYRGQGDRFLKLALDYLTRTLTCAGDIGAKAETFRQSLAAVAKETQAFVDAQPKGSPLRVLRNERDSAASSCSGTLRTWVARVRADWKKPPRCEIAALNQRLAELTELATACHDLVKAVDMVHKLSARLTDSAEKEHNARGNEAWDSRAIARKLKDLDAARGELVEQLKQTAYFHRQVHWLLSRFPEGRFTAVPGLCKAVSKTDIERADWSLTPGRFVGVAPQEVDEDFDFEGAIGEIRTELADLNNEAAALAEKIQQNLLELGA